MPSGLSLLYKKGRPKIGKKKNKIYSLAKRKGNRHVDRKMLDAMFSPVYSVTKKDYGISSVFDDSAASGDDIPESGNMSSLQCQPGRQVYFETYALPCRSMPYKDYTSVIESPYKRPWSFIELLYGAFKRNSYLNQVASQVMQPSTISLSTTAIGDSMLDPQNTNLFSQFFKLKLGTGIDYDLLDFVENTLSNARFNFKFQYMGGHQTHKFQNTTTLPIHIEIREFSPRQPMNYDVVRRTISPPLATAYVSDCYKAPGMWQTLMADLLRQFDREQTSADAGGAQYQYIPHEYFDEIDDKMFKYNTGCKDTNFRWIVGNPIKATIYPGETFTYKMVLPPFSGDSLTFLQTVQRWWKYTAITDGTTTTEMSNVGNTPGFMPGFSKFASIRIVGSRAYKAAATNDSNVVDPDYVTDAKNNAYASAGMVNPSNNAGRPITAVATHGVRVTHTQVEHHAIRTFAVHDARTHIYHDFTANAKNTGDILPGDQMKYIDQLENNEEAIPGDNI